MIINHISKILGEKRLSIQDLATAADISYQTAHHLYHDKTSQIRLETVDKICKALNIQPGDIFTYIDE